MTHPSRPRRPALTAGSLLVVGTLLAFACSSSSSSPDQGNDAGTDAPITPSDGGTVTIGPSGFNQACQSSSDCVLVEVGQWSATDPCCGHGCPGAAINAADQAKYSAATSKAVMHCAPAGASGCGVDCAAIEAFCNSGTCDTCIGVGCADAGAADAAAE
jgi:hypothetical protein